MLFAVSDCVGAGTPQAPITILAAVQVVIASTTAQQISTRVSEDSVCSFATDEDVVVPLPLNQVNQVSSPPPTM